MAGRANPTETEKRLDRIEAAINGLAFFETRLAPIQEGLCPELDEIRAERFGSVGNGRERRPSSLPERRDEPAVL